MLAKTSTASSSQRQQMLTRPKIGVSMGAGASRRHGVSSLESSSNWWKLRSVPGIPPTCPKSGIQTQCSLCVGVAQHRLGEEVLAKDPVQAACIVSFFDPVSSVPHQVAASAHASCLPEFLSMLARSGQERPNWTRLRRSSQERPNWIRPCRSINR